MTKVEARMFEYECQGLLRLVESASVDRPLTPDSPLYAYVQPAWARENAAIWQARHVMREAVTFGLYPSTAQIERELRRAA